MARSIFLFLAVLALLCGSAAAETTPVPWQPPVPEENGWDWIRMTSGEWFGGTIELMRDRDLEFDSDELGILNLDWTDVAELRSPRILTYRFDPEGTVTGTALMQGDSLVIDVGGTPTTRPRHNLVLIMEGQLREKNYWSAKASVGIVTRSGNSSQADMNSVVRIRRLTPKTRGLFNYAGNYGKVEGIENINNHNLSLGVDILITAGFFVTPLGVNFLRDPFQNIDMKSTVGAGVGYAVLRDGPINWSLGISGGYQKTEYVSVEEGKPLSVENATMIFSTDLEWDITGDVEMLLDYNLQMGIPETSQAFHHARLEFSFDIWGDVLDLDLGLTWDRVESPQATSEGIIPERDDFRSTIGIGFEI
jgi:hypothetical protein